MSFIASAYQTGVSIILLKSLGQFGVLETLDFLGNFSDK